jgi:hypothetical protein
MKMLETFRVLSKPLKRMQVCVIRFLERCVFVVCDISVICGGQETKELTSYRNVCLKPEIEGLVGLQYLIYTIM